MGPKLRKLTIRDYRSFVEECDVEFPESGLVSLNGINKDTGGGSGSGKSNLLNAIAFALGFSPLSFTDFQSWYSDKSPSITLELDTDLGPVKIVRGKTLKLFINDEEIPGSVAQKEDKIDLLFGMNAEFRKLLTYRGQRQPGSFLSNTDSKKKEFLMQILGLDKFENALEVGAKNVTRLEGSVNTSKALVTQLGTTISGFDNSENLENLLADTSGLEAVIGVEKAGLLNLKNKLTTLQKDIQTETNKILNANKIFYQDALDQCEILENEQFTSDVDRTELNRLAKMVVGCKERIDALTEEDRQRKSTQQKELRKIQEIVDFENGKIAQIPGLDSQRKRLQIEMVKLDAGRCAMCDREWDESQAKRVVFAKELEGVLAKIKEFNECKATVVELQKQMLPFSNFETNPKIAQMVQAKVNLESQHAVEKQKIDGQKAIFLSEKNTKIAEAKHKASAILAEGEKEARELRESRWNECETIGAEIQALNTSIAADQEIYNDLQRRITRAQYADEQCKLYQPKLDEAVQQLSAYEAELASEKDFLGLIGREGFLGSIFDEILEEISTETNNMLANIANVRHTTIEFKSEVLTQKGTVNRSIVPVVTVGSHESTLKSGLSGGMLSVVELATDLAVGKVIATRTGTCPQFLILDEALDGLGIVEKESALELIQNYAQNRLVIMTDHSSETKALFQKMILVEYSNGRSIVV
jgi:DNA repair exonuclease SbcCD ATPase subunit